MVGTFCRILFRHDLDVEGPSGKVLLFDALVEVALVAFPVLGDDRLRLLVGQVFDPLLGLEVELDPETLIFSVDQAESVAAEAVHVPIGVWDSSVAHDDGDLVERLGKGAPEIPVVLGAAHVRAGVPFHGVVEVGELQGIAQEEDRRVVPHQVPVPLLGVEFHREAPNIALGVGGAAFASDGRKA